MSHERYLHRQGLLALVITQLSVVLLHWSRLTLWLWLLCFVVLVWRVQIYRGQWRFPSQLLRVLLVVSSLTTIVLYYKEWYSLEPMITLLIMAFLLKLLEVKQYRDAVILIYVGYVVAVSAYLFDQGIVATGGGIIAVWLLTACLFTLQTSVTPFISRITLRKVSAILLQAVPVMLLMLFVFPRVGALWSVPLQSSSGVTGISDSMSPGDFSQLTRSSELAFRVSFDGDRIPSPAERYWRGLVLTDFDGRRWRRMDDARLTLNQPTLNQPQYSPHYQARSEENTYGYEVVLEPTNTPWLYAIPLAEITNKATLRSTTNELLLEEPATQRIKYNATSNPDFVVSESQVNLQRSLLLPQSYNPKALAQARLWREQSSSEQDYIQRVLAFYHQRFFYTLSPPVLGRHTVDEFLFSVQRGFCEHFASSFVVLMRAAGIPARVVTGYQGGEWNADNQYLIVRQYDAHAWAEVWLADQGWVRFDPTGAVAPNRIERGLFESLPEVDQELVGGKQLPSFAWLNRLALRWDHVNYRWQRWVLSYDEQTQSQWLQQLLGEVTALRLALLLVIPASLMMAFFAFLTLRQFNRPVAKNVQLYHYFMRRLQVLGIPRQHNETLADLCAKAKALKPDQYDEILFISQQLNRLLYEKDAPISADSFRYLKKRILAL